MTASMRPDGRERPAEVVARARAAPALARRVASGAFWASVESWAQQLLQFVVFVVLARLLGPEAYGLVGVALIVVAVGETLVSSAGWAEALIQRRELDPSYRNSVLWVLLGLAGALAGAAWLLRDVAAAALGTPEVAAILPWLALSLPLTALGVVPPALLRRQLRFRPLALRTIAAAGTAGSVAIVMAWAGFGLWSLVAYQVLQPLVEAAVLWSMAGWRPEPRISRRAIGDVLAFVSGLFGERVLVLVDALLPRILLALTLGPVALGLYTFARKIFDVLGRLLVGPLGRVAMPTFSAIRDDRGRTQRALTFAVQLSSLLAVPVFLGLALTADDVVPLVFGTAWTDAVPAVRIFAALGFATPLTGLSSALMIGIGKSREQFVLALVGTALLVVLLLAFLTTARTVEAVVLAIVARYWLMLPLRLLWLVRHARVSLRETLHGVGPVLVSAVTMVAAVLLVRGRLPVDPSPTPLAVTVLVGGVTYFATLLLLGRPLLRRAGTLAQLLHAPRRGTADSRTMPGGRGS